MTLARFVRKIKELRMRSLATDIMNQRSRRAKKDAGFHPSNCPYDQHSLS